MNWAFVGQNILGGAALIELLRAPRAPTLVVTREESDYPNDVLRVALERRLDVQLTSDINKESRARSLFASSSIDLVFCCAWGQRIREPLLRAPRIGWINLHPSMLPSYRGPRPIEWQLINGETFAGCTAHFMTTRFDDGPILRQRKIAIGEDDTRATLQKKCGELLGRLGVECLDLIDQQPSYSGADQDETLATYAPPCDDIRDICLERPAAEIRNLVRALSPYPCALLKFRERAVKIVEVEMLGVRPASTEIGEMTMASDGTIVIAATDRLMRVTAHEVVAEPIC